MNQYQQYITPVRDIQKALGTSERTYDDTQSFIPEMLTNFDTAVSGYVKSFKSAKEDLKPLSEAVKKMKDTFLAEQPVASKKDDYMNQLTHWAYAQGYDSSQIKGVFDEYQVSDVTEDVNKFLKQSSANADNKARLMIEQGYKIDPTAANDDMAIQAFNTEMSRAYYLDAGTKKYITQVEIDPGLADGTLKELSRDYIQSLGGELSRTIQEAGGSRSLTRQQLDNYASQRTQDLIAKGLPEWYATYVVDMAVYPFQRIADSAGEERVKATESLENYEKNLNTQAVHDFLQQNIMGSDRSNRDYQVMKTVLGEQAVPLILNAASGDLKKNLLLGKYSNDSIDSWSKLAQEQPYAVADATKISFKVDNAWSGLLRSAAPEVQQTITNLGLGMKSTIPAVSQAAINQGQTALNAAKMYNAAPDSSIASDTAAHNPIEERKQITGTLAANAAEEVRVFGTDKMVYMNNYGNTSLMNSEGQPVGADRVQERELRRIETMVTKMSRQTEEPIASLAVIHNDMAMRALGWDNMDKGTKEWEEMTPEEQQAEMNRGETEEKTAKVPPIPPRKPAEITGEAQPRKLPTIAELLIGRTKELFGGEQPSLTDLLK